MAYTKVTNFAVKDGLPTGNPSKIVKGTEIDVEFNALQAESTAITSALAGKQPIDATLTSLSALGTAADKLAYTTAVDTWGETPITAAARSVLDDATVTDMRVTLGAASSGANTDLTSLSGLTTPLTVAQGGTGSSTHTLNNVLLGNTTSAFGEVAPGTSGNVLTSNGTTWISTTPSEKIESVTATQATGALTIALNPTTLDFRSTTLTTGVPNTRSVGSAISLVVPSGATLGSVSTISSRLILVAIDNAGTVELAVVNLAGGNDLSETGLISTSAIDTASDSATVFYSTTARSNIPYRVVGAVDVVNTAGAWGSPTLVQGYGGQALSAMSSLGYGQTWQNVTGSRSIGTTYYNTTGKPILVTLFTGTNTAGWYWLGNVGGISGAVASNMPYATNTVQTIQPFIVPPGTYYSVAQGIGTATPSMWAELR